MIQGYPELHLHFFLRAVLKVLPVQSPIPHPRVRRFRNWQSCTNDIMSARLISPKVHDTYLFVDKIPVPRCRSFQQALPQAIRRTLPSSAVSFLSVLSSLSTHRISIRCIFLILYLIPPTSHSQWLPRSLSSTYVSPLHILSSPAPPPSSLHDQQTIVVALVGCLRLPYVTMSVNQGCTVQWLVCSYAHTTFHS